MNIWVEKYRPSKVEDLISTSKNLNIIKGIIEKKQIPNMTISSKYPGIGKTTIAKLLANNVCEKDEILFINGSIDRGIDTLRNEMTQFVLSNSFEGNRKCIIIDEAEGLTAATQQALRNFIEEYHKESAFILTCNYASKIIEPILSRCPILDLTADDSESKKSLAFSILERCKYILNNENISFDEKILPPIIKSYFPDIRKIINELQTFSMSGNLTLNAIPNDFIDGGREIVELLEALNTKDFNKIRNWSHKYFSVTDIYNRIYTGLFDRVRNEYKSEFILTVADYSYKSSVTLSQEINLTALVTELMKGSYV